MKTWMFVLILVFVSLAVSKESCVSRGLKAHGDRVPYEAVGSTDPNIPLDPRLFDFNFYSTKTPHTFATQDEADEMAAELCGANDLSTVLLGPEHELEENLAHGSRQFNDLLLLDDDEEAPGADAPPMACSSLPGRMCSWSQESCGTRGYDLGQCPGNWWCCKPEGTAPPAATNPTASNPAATAPNGQAPMACKNDPDRMCSYGADSCGARGFDEGECDGDWRCCKDERRATGFSGTTNVDAGGVTLGHTSVPGAGVVSNSTQLVGLRGNTFTGSIEDFPIPLPAFPPLKMTLGASLSVTQATTSMTFTGKLTVGVAFDVRVVKVSMYVSVSGSIASAAVTVKNTYRPPTVYKSFKTAAQYAIYGNLGAIKTTVDTVTDGLTSGLKSTNTPSRPTEALRLYAEGFNHEYVELFSDEWNYVTAAAPANPQGGGATWANRPSDAVIVEALRRIERMLQTTPTQRPDGSIVWEYTASSEWLSTKLFYKMNGDNSWQWSPDNQNWMRMNEMTVRGGRWNGQKPTDDNQKTIQAIHLIYVQNPSLGNMLRDGAASSALEVDAKNQWPQWLDNAIGSGSQALTEAGQRLVAAARRQFSNFNEFWNRVKAGIQETGAYRAAKRTFFRDDAPKKPMRVFAELAERMRVEGFGSEGLAARAFYAADAAVFGDFTRILSMREALFAFCYKNKDIADRVGEHMDRIVAARRARSSGARTSVFQSNMENVREDAVRRELAAKDGGASAVAASKDAAERLFGKIAPELVEKFEQIRTMANMVAQRLRNAGDPDWAALDDNAKREYSDHFLRIRGLVGSLHSQLVEINRGDGWLTRGLLGGLAYVKQHVGTAMEQGRAKLREIMEREGVKVTLSATIEIGIGFSPSAPTVPNVPSASISLQVAAQAGWVGVMDPSAFSDTTKTVSGTFTGLNGVASGSVSNGGTKQLKASISFTRVVPSSAQSCTALLKAGLTDCKVLSVSLSVAFPGNLGLSESAVNGIVIAALVGGAVGTGVADEKWKVIIGNILNPFVPGVNGSGATIEPGDRATMAISALADAVLPVVIAIDSPLGSPTMSLKLDVSLYWAKKDGVDVWGLSNLRLGFGFSARNEITAKIAEFTQAFAGAKVAVSAETGIFFNIKDMIFRSGTEWPVSNAPAVPAIALPPPGANVAVAAVAPNAANAAANPAAPSAPNPAPNADGASDAAVSVRSRVLSRDCDPALLARRIEAIREAAKSGAADPLIKENLVATLGDLERKYRAKCTGSK